MILALLNPQDLFKNTSYLWLVWSWSSRDTRTKQDQPGPVLDDPCYSCSSDLFKPILPVLVDPANINIAFNDFFYIDIHLTIILYILYHKDGHFFL